MARQSLIALSTSCLALFATGGAALAGNAFTSSSYVGPPGVITRPSPLTKAQRTTMPVASAEPMRPPLRNHVPAWSPPTVSPYLNLFQPGVSRVFNYYTLVRPQLVQEQINQRQSAQLESLRQQATTRGAPASSPGNSGRFQNYGGYYRGRR